MHEFEKKIVVMFNRHSSRELDAASAIISSILFLAFVWIAVALAAISRSPLTGIFLVAGLAIVFMLHFTITEGIIKWGGKNFKLRRTRPYKAYPDEVRPIGRKFADSSFPSSHMASMVGGFVVMVSFYKALLPWALVATVLMAWSRLRNGMHYPSDILVGIILGLGYGFASMYILGILL
jgi:undecaprenyl-diphosphatase